MRRIVGCAVPLLLLNGLMTNVNATTNRSEVMPSGTRNSHSIPGLSVNLGDARTRLASPSPPCLTRSWIPRGGMPTAERDWRVVRLAVCATERWWRGHAREVLTIVHRESGYSPYATNPDDGVACWAGTYGSCGLGQHLIRYWPARAATYLRREWFKVWPVPWWNARANMIVTVRMMAAQDGVCPAWC